jgi:hypothetical protein
MMWPWRSVSMRPSNLASSASANSSAQRRMLKSFCAGCCGSSIVSIGTSLPYSLAVISLKLAEPYSLNNPMRNQFYLGPKRLKPTWWPG